MQGGHRGAAAPQATAPRQLPALPLGNPNLVLFSLSFSFRAKGGSSPDLAQCPRNTPSFPELALIACSSPFTFPPCTTRVPLQPHTCADAVLTGD